MTTARGAICFACKHFRSWPNSTIGTATCAAYPAGIPDAIIFGGFDHRKEFGGEKFDVKGEPITFELEKGAEEQLAGYERAVLE